MLKWSMNLFRIRGIMLAVHSSFFLLLAYVAWDGWDGGGWRDLCWSVGMLLAFFTCVVLHELGHSFTAMHYGVGVRRILLMPIGGMAEFDSIPREPRRELLITLAGPAVNFVIAAVLWLIVGLPEGWELFGFDAYPADAVGFAQLLLGWNILMGCFNLVPVFPMDGGRIFRALLATQLDYVRATFWAATVGKILSVIAALVVIFFWQRYLTAALFAFIFFAGEAEYRAIKRRELEDARWRETLARLASQQDLVEPPVLSP